MKWSPKHILWSQQDIDIAPSNAEKQFWLQQLPKTFIEVIQKYHRWQDAWASISGYKLLHKLSTHVDLPINLKELRRDKKNKPFIPNHVSFNISHTNNKVVCAIQKEGVIGIDIEKMQEINPNDFNRVFHENEIKLIKDSCIPTFFETWTKKEAVIKALGTGFFENTKEIDTTKKTILYNNLPLEIHQLNTNTPFVSHLCTSITSPIIIEV